MGKQRPNAHYTPKSISVFNFSDYRPYVRTRISMMPKGGRGEFRKISKALRMHTTLVSQVFNGLKRLTSEQACLLCDYFGLNALETDYFVKLVEIERAGSEPLRMLLMRQLREIHSRSLEVAGRLPQSTTLSDEERAIFYSSWQYSAIRLLTSIPAYRNIDTIAACLGLTKNRTRAIMDFLLAKGLCQEDGGLFRIGPQIVHVPAQSPFSQRHHLNWRTKVLASIEQISDEELVFTSPLTIAKKDIPVVKALLLETIEKVAKVVEKTEPEQLLYFGIDWIRMK